MTEEMEAYASAQRAIGLVVGLAVGLNPERHDALVDGIKKLDESLDALLELAERPEIIPAAEKPSPTWHYAGVEGLYCAIPAPGEFVLTWSNEDRAAAPLQILKASFEPPDHVIWRNSLNIIFPGRVDYWMPIPPIPSVEEK